MFLLNFSPNVLMCKYHAFSGLYWYMKDKKTTQNTTSDAVMHAISDLKGFMLDNFETKRDANARELRLESKKDAEARETRLTSKLTRDAEIRNLRLELRMDEAFRKMDEKSQLYRDQILTRQDSFVKRLDDIDANIAIQGNDVEELGKRVTRLESGKN